MSSTRDHTLGRLAEIIEDRKRHPSESSYTARLLAGGVQRIGAKLLEEAAEAVEAAGEPGEEGRRHLVHEAADLLYHLLVLLAARDVQLADVDEELARRMGTSGLAEKASRGDTRSAQAGRPETDSSGQAAIRPDGLPRGART